jgi:hypothetical protein
LRKIPTILAIDPASNKAGVALYYNEILRSALLTGYGNWTQRITQQRQQLELFLNHYLPENEIINHLVVENVSGFRNSKLSYSVGALCSLPCIQSDLNLVSPAVWKRIVRKYGGGKSTKGFLALQCVRPAYPQVSDDEADAILMLLAYLEKGFVDDDNSVD